MNGYLQILQPRFYVASNCARCDFPLSCMNSRPANLRQGIQLYQPRSYSNFLLWIFTWKQSGSHSNPVFKVSGFTSCAYCLTWLGILAVSLEVCAKELCKEWFFHRIFHFSILKGECQVGGWQPVFTLGKRKSGEAQSMAQHPMLVKDGTRLSSHRSSRHSLKRGRAVIRGTLHLSTRPVQCFAGPQTKAESDYQCEPKHQAKPGWEYFRKRNARTQTLRSETHSGESQSYHDQRTWPPGGRPSMRARLEVRATFTGVFNSFRPYSSTSTQQSCMHSCVAWTCIT